MALDDLHSTLALGPDGDLEIPVRLKRGAEAIEQRLRNRLRFFLAEWFLDARLGVPYFRDVLVKNPDLDLVRSIIRRVILGTPGVASLRKFDVELDRLARRLDVTDFEAILDDGSPLRPDEPFIVEVL